MAFDAMRKFLARSITGRVKVYKIEDFNIEPPEIKKLKKSVEVTHYKPEIKISVSKPFDFDKEIKCNAKNFNFSRDYPLAKVSKYKIKKYVKQDVKVQKFSLNKKLRIWKPLKQIQALPQERKNMLKLQKNKPKVAVNEAILAWYWPIVDKAVIKLVLDKQRGTLLVWYSPTSRQHKARGVYLIRRLGIGEKPEWRWV